MASQPPGQACCTSGRLQPGPSGGPAMAYNQWRAEGGGVTRSTKIVKNSEGRSTSIYMSPVFVFSTDQAESTTKREHRGVFGERHERCGVRCRVVGFGAIRLYWKIVSWGQHANGQPALLGAKLTLSPPQYGYDFPIARS